MLTAGGFTGEVYVRDTHIGRLGVDADPGRVSGRLADGRTELRLHDLLSAVVEDLGPDPNYKSFLPN